MFDIATKLSALDESHKQGKCHILNTHTRRSKNATRASTKIVALCSEPSLEAAETIGKCSSDRSCEANQECDSPRTPASGYVNAFQGLLDTTCASTKPSAKCSVDSLSRLPETATARTESENSNFGYSRSVSEVAWYKILYENSSLVEFDSFAVMTKHLGIVRDARTSVFLEFKWRLCNGWCHWWYIRWWRHCRMCTCHLRHPGGIRWRDTNASGNVSCRL